MKHCPYCAEEIQDAAIKCKHCSSWLNAPVQQTSQPPAAAPAVQSSGLASEQSTIFVDPGQGHDFYALAELFLKSQRPEFNIYIEGHRVQQNVEQRVEVSLSFQQLIGSLRDELSEEQLQLLQQLLLQLQEQSRKGAKEESRKIVDRIWELGKDVVAPLLVALVKAAVGLPPG